MKITIDKLKKIDACAEGMEFFRMTLGRSAELEDVLNVLLEQEEYEWTRWLTRKVLSQRENVQLAVWCAEQVLPVFEAEFPEDKRPRQAIETVKRWLKGKVNMVKVEDVWKNINDISQAIGKEVNLAAFWAVKCVMKAVGYTAYRTVYSSAAECAVNAINHKNKAEFFKKLVKKTLEIIENRRKK